MALSLRCLANGAHDGTLSADARDESSRPGWANVVGEAAGQTRAGAALRMSQTERELQESRDRLQMVVMSEMAAGLAHELNQPLAAIVAYVDACRELVESGRMNGSQLADILRSVAGQAERAGQTIHRLRRMIKRSQPVRSPINVNDAVRDVTALLDIDARDSEVSVRLELDDVPSVVGDNLQIQQVVLNLMRNGFDAMADVPVNERRLTVHTGRTAEGEVEVVVADAGHGLSNESSERLFEPFFTRKSNGLGLGLSVSRTIVEAHGGRIGITANSTRGVTARFTLPVADGKGPHDSESHGFHRR